MGTDLFFPLMLVKEKRQQVLQLSLTKKAHSSCSFSKETAKFDLGAR